jgi:AcrR family transcriptional regulator
MSHPPVAPHARRGRPRDPDAAGRIKAAAADLLLERGYERMTVDDVAERAGVGKATVYRRWPSKDELAYDALAALLDVEVPTPDTGSMAGDLTQVYADLITFLGTPRGLNFLRLAASESGRDERIGALYRQAVERRIEMSMPSFQRAIERGEVRADADLSAVCEAVLGVLVLRALIGSPLPTIEDIPRMVALTLDGIRGR